MGKGRIASTSSRDEKETRRTSSPRFAHDHLERRQGPRSSRVNSVAASLCRGARNVLVARSTLGYKKP